MAQVERPHLAAVALEGVAMIVLIRCPTLTKIMFKNPGISQMILSMRSGPTTAATFTR